MASEAAEQIEGKGIRAAKTTAEEEEEVEDRLRNAHMDHTDDGSQPRGEVGP